MGVAGISKRIINYVLHCNPDRGSHTVRLTQCCPFTVRILTRGTYGRVLDGQRESSA